jgi:hypothetical protein
VIAAMRTCGPQLARSRPAALDGSLPALSLSKCCPERIEGPEATMKMSSTQRPRAHEDRVSAAAAHDPTGRRRLQTLVGPPLLVGGGCLLEDEQIRARRPTVVAPKRCPRLIVPEEKDVALRDASVTQALETPLQQPGRNSLMTMGWIDSQVMQVAATSIMATQDRRNHLAVLELAHRAHAGVA